MKKDRLLFCLTLALIASTAIAVYALISKRCSAPSVVYVFEGRKLIDKLAEQSFDHSFFWDNFPYHVVANNGKKIQNAMLVNPEKKTVSLKDLIDNKPKIIFRYLPGRHSEVSDTTLQMIKRLNLDHILIFSNQTTLSSPVSDLTNLYFIDQEQLDYDLDGTATSYLCVINSDLSIDRLYFPQKENIPLIEKYLIYNYKYLNTK